MPAAVALVHKSGSWRVVAFLETSGDLPTDGHAESGHAVEHLAADPGFDLLCGQRPGAERSADDGLVAQHCGLDERAPAVADGLLPSQSALAAIISMWRSRGVGVPAAAASLATAVVRGGMITLAAGARSATAR
jgi:hypothetical protein